MRPWARPFVIEPWVFRAPDDGHITLERGEIAEAVWCSWSGLARPKRPALRRVGPVPLVVGARRCGRRVVWGLTGRVLDDLFALPTRR